MKLLNLLSKQFSVNEPEFKDHNLSGKTIQQTAERPEASFLFMGDSYSLDILRNASLVKTYLDMRFEKIGLYLDCYNRMFIKTLRKNIEFGHTDDCASVVYNFVKTECEADMLYKSDQCLWGVEPYIYETVDGMVSVHEQRMDKN